MQYKNKTGGTVYLPDGTAVLRGEEIELSQSYGGLTPVQKIPPPKKTAPKKKAKKATLESKPRPSKDEQEKN
jgi:hypothetical protein